MKLSANLDKIDELIDKIGDRGPLVIEVLPGSEYQQAQALRSLAVVHKREGAQGDRIPASQVVEMADLYELEIKRLQDLFDSILERMKERRDAREKL